MLPIDAQITFLYTQNLQQSAEFYEVVLGLQLALDQGSCRIYRMINQTSYIGLCENPVQKPADGIIFTIVTQDVDAWYQKFITHKIACDGKPRINQEYGIYHFFVHDPNGYLIEVQRFLDDPWDKHA